VPLLFVVCQDARYAPHIKEWVEDACAVVYAEDQFSEWTHKLIVADIHNGFNFLDVYSQVAEVMGPVILLSSLKKGPIAGLMSKLKLGCIVRHYEHINNATDIYSAVVETLTLHESGEPFIPLNLAIALLMLRKLIDGDRWGGDATNKAYMWADDLGRGRGIPENLRGNVLNVANTLALKGLLKTKGSQGKTKYALNPDARKQIHELLNHQKIHDEGLERFLLDARHTVSTRLLDERIWQRDDE
jgi:hypothetical protein